LELNMTVTTELWRTQDDDDDDDNLGVNGVDSDVENNDDDDKEMPSTDSSPNDADRERRLRVEVEVEDVDDIIQTEIRCFICLLWHEASYEWKKELAKLIHLFLFLSSANNALVWYFEVIPSSAPLYSSVYDVTSQI